MTEITPEYLLDPFGILRLSQKSGSITLSPKELALMMLVSAEQNDCLIKSAQRVSDLEFNINVIVRDSLDVEFKVWLPDLAIVSLAEFSFPMRLKDLQREQEDLRWNLLKEYVLPLIED
jgi:hypothetical protein